MSSENLNLWTTRLAESRTALLNFLNQLSLEEWDATVYSDGGDWSISTVVGHIADSERGMSIQVHKIRKGEETVPEGFDLTRWNAGVEKRIGDMTPEQFLEALEQTRARTLQVMDSLSDNEWTLTGRHPGRGVITIEQYYETMYGHELTHGADIRQALAK